LISLEAHGVILLTKLDKHKVLVLIDNIKYIESTPDTLVRFINGDMLIVCETMDEIANLVFNFKRKCLSQDLNSASALAPVNESGGPSSWT